MTLARTALRLAAIEGLAPTGTKASDAWPTIARHRVFDSRLDMLDDLAADERAPVIVVYTDTDDGTSGDPSGGPPFKRFVDLVFEISVVAFAEQEGSPETFVPYFPVTDAQTEAALDLLEAGIAFALLKAPTGILFQRLVRGKVPTTSSAPQRSSEEAVRVAMRTVTWRCQIPDDCFDMAPAALASGNDRLPEPLRSVVAGLAATAYGQQIAAGLAAFAPRAPVRTPLSGVGLNHDIASPQGVTDGTIDVAATVTIPQT